VEVEVAAKEEREEVEGREEEGEAPRLWTEEE